MTDSVSLCTSRRKYAFALGIDLDALSPSDSDPYRPRLSPASSSLLSSGRRGVFDTFHSPYPLGNREAIRVTASCAFDAWTTDTLVAPPSAEKTVHVESLGGCDWAFTVGVSKGSTNNVQWTRESLGHYTVML